MTLQDLKPLFSDITQYAQRSNFTPEALVLEFGGRKGLLSAVVDNGRVVLHCENIPALSQQIRPLAMEEFAQSADALQAIALQHIDGVQRLPEDMAYPDDFILEQVGS